MGALEAFMTGNSETGPGKNVRVMLEATNEIVERFEHPVDHVLKFWDPKVKYGHQLMAHWQVRAPSPPPPSFPSPVLQTHAG